MTVLADLPRRTKVVALLGLASILVGVGALSFGPLVRGRARAAAERRGLQLEIGRVKVGFGALWLEDIQLRVPRLPGLTAHVDALRVGVSWRFEIAGLGLYGAQLELKGDVDDLQRQWAAYRNERSSEAPGGGPRRDTAQGVDIVWRVQPGRSAQRVWGLSYERDGVRERIALELARWHDEGVDLELCRARLVLAIPAGSSDDLTAGIRPRRQLESLQADGLEVGIVAALAPPASKAVEAQKRHQFQPDSLRGAKLRIGLSELAAFATRSLPDGAGLNLDGVSVHFRQGSEGLNFGPSSLRVIRAGAQLGLSLAPKAEASGTPLEFKLTLPLAGGEAQAQVRGGPVSLRSLGVREGDFGLIDVQAATLRASGDLTLASDASSLAFSGNGQLDHVSLRRSELSASPLSGIRLAFSARGNSSLDGAKFVLDEADLSLGDVRVQGQGSLLRGERQIEAHGSGGVPLASCQAVLDAMPSGFAPLISKLRMAGTFAVQAQLDYDSEHPSETRVRLNVANDCHIEQIPSELSPRRFASRFMREVKGADKQPMELESGPGSADWVPYDAISPFMETAVLVCEDGHFPVHRGFDFEAIEKSIRDNLIQGRFARGASTITMQLAKNLYLRKEKTLGRKLQEAVLTQLLEQELNKRELMELYLNVIEYAPGIFGIGPAARYYFAKRPSDLSLGQALYIASILPNPAHQHFNPDGKVSLGWTRYLQRLMHIAKKIGHISDEQLAIGLAEQVVFHVADSGAAPPLSDSFPEEGTDTPSELSP